MIAPHTSTLLIEAMAVVSITAAAGYGVLDLLGPGWFRRWQERRAADEQRRLRERDEGNE